MWLLDQWAERHIRDAQTKGEFDNLPGSGEPLVLDDDSHIPPELRAGYRLLKNAGCLPPELEQRKEAVELADLLKGIRKDDPRHGELCRRLALVELKLCQAGIDTDFLHGEYSERLMQKINEE
ncbi:DUF1992 domain-containing protein [Enterobacter cloacae]|uniref:DnaJ family domain-containing protein n=1 Tax=Enterobacter cloacae TaxID=550 RepID=UPI0032AFB5E4